VSPSRLRVSGEQVDKCNLGDDGRLFNGAFLVKVVQREVGVRFLLEQAIRVARLFLGCLEIVRLLATGVAIPLHVPPQP
jgi:hypothetical protein